MKKEYGFGIIGTGMIAGFHAQAISQLDNARLVSVHDIAADRANAFAKEKGCQAYDNLDKFLADNDLDVVTICTPSGSHMEPAIAAAKHGKHVICEKPLDVSLERIDKMIEAHQKAGTQLGAVFNARFEPVNQALKKLITAGRLGRVTYGGGYVPWYRVPEYYSASEWKGTRKFDGGGALMNQGSHTVDLLQWLMGQRVKRVTAFTATSFHKIEVEDCAAAALEFENGALGILFASTSMYPGVASRVEIGGTEGTFISESTALKYLSLKDQTGEEDEFVKKFGGAGDAQGAGDPAAIRADNHRHNFAAFLKAMDAGKTPELDGQEARKAVQTILAVYESARTSRPVEL